MPTVCVETPSIPAPVACRDRARVEAKVAASCTRRHATLSENFTPKAAYGMIDFAQSAFHDAQLRRSVAASCELWRMVRRVPPDAAGQSSEFVELSAGHGAGIPVRLDLGLHEFIHGFLWRGTAFAIPHGHLAPQPLEIVQ